MKIDKLGLDSSSMLLVEQVKPKRKYLKRYYYPISFDEIKQDLKKTYGSGEYFLMIKDQRGRYIKNELFDI